MLNPNYYIPDGALVITPNAYNNNAQYIRVSVASGAAIKVFYPSLRSQAGTYPLGYAPDNTSRRRWVITARNTSLGDPGENYYIYMRLATDGTAMLVFSKDNPSVKKATSGKFGEEIWIPIDDDNGYWWVHIGTMEYMESTGRYSMQPIDTGMLDTEAGLDDKLNGNEVFTYNRDNYTITLNGDWHFNLLKATNVEVTESVTADHVSADKVTINGEQITDVLNGPYKDEEGNDIQGDTATDNSNEHLVTSGWLVGSWLTWLKTLFQGMFLRKDVDDATEHKLTMGSAEVTNDATIGKNLTVGETASAKNVEADEKVKAKDADISDAAKARKFRTHDFVQDELLGSGVAMWQEDIEQGDGENAQVAHVGHIETDFMSVRRSAFFRELTIEEVKHIGGELILSQAAGTVARVAGAFGGEWVFDTAGKLCETTAFSEGMQIAYFRLYFDKNAGGKTSFNEWRVGDQCRCWSAGGLDEGTSTMVRTTYYWRLVTRVSDADNEDDDQYWINVSNSTDNVSLVQHPSVIPGPGCDVGSTLPQVNDSIALLGCRDKLYPSRTSAQVYSTADDNAPSRRYYHGITSFSVVGCAVEQMEWDNTECQDGSPVGVHWHVGTDDEFIDYNRRDGLRISASKVVMGGKTVEEHIHDTLPDAVHTHIAESVDPVLPYPNDFDPDGDHTYPYKGEAYDAFTAEWAGHEDEHIGEYYLAMNGYLFLFTVKDEMEVYPDSGDYGWHIVTDRYLYDVENKVNGYTAEFTEFKNQVSSYEKVINDLTKQVVAWKESGLVTTSDYATLFSKYVNSEGIAKTAEISTSIKEGISSAHISAEQVNLQGFISANDRLFIDEDANLYAEQGVFGGLVRSNWTVVCKGNAEQYGYYAWENDELEEGQRILVIDIRKTGPLFMIYAENSAGNTDEYYSTFGVDIIRLSMPNIQGLQTDGWHHARKAIEAQKYIGQKVKVIYNDYENASLEISGGKIFSENSISDARFEGFFIQQSMIEMDCVRTTIEDAPAVVWDTHIVEYTKPYNGQYLWFLPTYHWEGDYIRNLYKTMFPEHKYELYGQWQRLKSKYNQVLQNEDRYTAATVDTLKTQYNLLDDYMNKQPFLTITDNGDKYLSVFSNMEFSVVLESEGKESYKDELAQAWDDYYAAYDALMR